METGEINEAELVLIRRTAEGDEAAFTQITEKYEKLVYNMARFYIKNPDDALDISQEVFLRLWRTAAQFRGECSLSSWIYRLTKNICADFSRKKKIRETVPLSATDTDGEELALEIPDYDMIPENEILRREIVSAVRSAITQLGDDYREIIILRDIKAYSYEEISEILLIPVNTVKSRLSRARQSLKKILSDGNKF